MTEDNQEPRYDTTEKVERTDVGYRLSIESTRGTGTRDQDKVKVEARTETIQELVDQREALRVGVENTMNEIRANQPDEEEEEDG